MNATHTRAEIWKPVVGFEGWYEVSNYGRVKSLRRMTNPSTTGRQRSVPEKMLKFDQNIRDRHFRAPLSRGAKTQKFLVHRLVLMAFVGPCPPGMEGCHNNGNPIDNRLENLRWDTRSANTLDKVRHGTHPHAKRTHCAWGHELSGANLRVNKARNYRVCRECVKRKNRNAYLRRLARLKTPNPVA